VRGELDSDRLPVKASKGLPEGGEKVEYCGCFGDEKNLMGTSKRDIVGERKRRGHPSVE